MLIFNPKLKTTYIPCVLAIDLSMFIYFTYVFICLSVYSEALFLFVTLSKSTYSPNIEIPTDTFQCKQFLLPIVCSFLFPGFALYIFFYVPVLRVISPLNPPPQYDWYTLFLLTHPHLPFLHINTSNGYFTYSAFPHLITTY